MTAMVNALGDFPLNDDWVYALAVKLEATDSMSERLLRLPLWRDIEDSQPQIIEALSAVF